MSRLKGVNLLAARFKIYLKIKISFSELHTTMILSAPKDLLELLKEEIIDILFIQRKNVISTFYKNW